jgi:hypothetical protein
MILLQESIFQWKMAVRGRKLTFGGIFQSKLYVSEFYVQLLKQFVCFTNERASGHWHG